MVLFFQIQLCKYTNFALNSPLVYVKNYTKSHFRHSLTELFYKNKLHSLRYFTKKDLSPLRYFTPFIIPPDGNYLGVNVWEIIK